jgi:UDP-2,3-diacylglucosamine pyrophosphatase LpxH
MKRNVELVVISDVHLGTYGCHAQELLNYLKSIKPETLILNGDIVDMWQFKKSYFPDLHLRVINKIIRLSLNGTKVYYLTGNHDEQLRRFTDMNFGNFHLRDSLELILHGKKHWFFHGDVFDASVMQTPWLAKIGGYSYDRLVRFNKVVNRLMKFLGKEPVSFSKQVKMKVKNAVKFISDFEKTAIDVARQKGFDKVICGHIHTPQYRHVDGVAYLNSGDWVENLTALEYNGGEWDIYKYDEKQFENEIFSKLRKEHTDEEDFPLKDNKAAMISQILNLATSTQY